MFSGFSGHGNSIHNIIPQLKKENIDQIFTNLIGETDIRESIWFGLLCFYVISIIVCYLMTREKHFEKTDQRTRKLMTAHKTAQSVYIISEMTWTDCICQEKKEEEESPAFKIASRHRYNDYNNV